jgi:hypothetical protein
VGGGAADAASPKEVGADGKETAPEASAEDCVNSVDDDYDGLVDCADPDCTPGYQCEDAVPPGWDGYYRLRKNKFDAFLPVETCPSGIKGARYYLDPDNTVTCQPCICDKPSNFLCGPPHIECQSDDKSCSKPWVVGWDAPTACETISTGFSSEHIISCRLTGKADVVKLGTCDPSTTTNLNTAMWKSMVDECSFASGAGCGAGACVLKSAGSNDGPLCIGKKGIVDCPVEWPEGMTIYASGADNRVCSACTCDVSAVKCAGGIYTFYDANACAPCPGAECYGEMQVGPGVDCRDLTLLADGHDFSAQVTSPAQPVSGCTPSGGEPSGSVEPAGEMTVCCKLATTR